MTFNSARIRHGVYRLFGERKGWDDFASTKQLLHPARDVRVRPAIHDPHCMERVSAMSPWRDPETERHLVTGGIRQFGETTALHLRGATIAGPMLYAGKNRFDIGHGDDRLYLEGATEICDSASLVSTWSGTRWFGCWLLEDIPQELISPNPDVTNVSMIGTPYRHLEAYRELLGLGHIPVATNTYFRNLTVYRGMNYYAHEPQFRVLRSRLRERLAEPANKTAAPVYLRRGTDGERRFMQNEDELVDRLTEWGFDIVSPEQDSVEEIARRTLDSPLIVSVEGSQLSHAIYSMADDATIVVIQPPARFAMVYKEFTDSMGMNFAFVVGKPAEQGSFTVVISELEALLGKCGL